VVSRLKSKPIESTTVKSSSNFRPHLGYNVTSWKINFEVKKGLTPCNEGKSRPKWSRVCQKKRREKLVAQFAKEKSCSLSQQNRHNALPFKA